MKNRHPSANGAASFQPGATPQERRSPRCRGPKARSNCRAVGSGFQPLGILWLVTQGLCVFSVGAAQAPRVLCSVPSMWLGAVVDVRLNDGRARIPKSQQGRPKLAHGFNRGLWVQNGWSPGGAKEKMGLERGVLSSLTGLVLPSHGNPAMNRWAISERPSGTGTHDVLNTTPNGAER